MNGLQAIINFYKWQALDLRDVMINHYLFTFAQSGLSKLRENKIFRLYAQM